MPDTPSTPCLPGAVRRWPGLWSVVVLGAALALAAVRSGAVDNPMSTDWWSLKPLSRPAVPKVPTSTSGPVHPIDAFIQQTLTAQGLHPSPAADRRTLIRRLYFDLLGLPPSPSEIEAFVTDTDPRAYEHLVDRLLASPQYGERWARHWLDVVHYGETHGYDKDQPRPNAWPYRDYVIRSFNQDKPYTRFIQEQVAGDVLFPGTRDGFEALGFIAAGPWDLIGHAEVPESKLDGKVARHLDRDDMAVNTLQTFNSLTVQCAQCHNHKFDPISQEDYYSLQAVFAAVDRADQKYDYEPDVAQQRKTLKTRRTELTSRRQSIHDAIANRAGPDLKQLDEQIATATKAVQRSEANGYHSAIEPKADVPKWVQVDLGQSQSLASVVLHPCHDDFNQIGAGFGFPVRFRVEISDDPEFARGAQLVGDYTQTNFANPKLQPVKVAIDGRTARYLRVTATQLAPRQNDYIFALAELSALTPDGRNVARGAAVTALDSIEAPVRWQKVNLTDGWFPGQDPLRNPEIGTLKQNRTNLLARVTTPEDQSALATLEQELKDVQSQWDQLPAQGTAFVAAVYQGSGAFTGTGAQGGKPRPIYLLSRGNIQKPGPEVTPGTLACLPDLPSRFELPANHAEGLRRAALAEWLISVQNPLTWRSVVNRVWQYHFGRGLVDTPNDFGRMGSLPTHPELLDWLAVEFRDGGQSLKSLHRLMVTSATYQQVSAVTQPEAARTDSDNRYLWRQNRRKLEAEAVRDAALSVAGVLDLKMGGPSFKDFVVEKPEHSPHYEYRLHNPNDPATHRRTIYRMIVRSQPQPFLTVLDCADPSMQVGKRNESVSPLQALAMMNNPLMLTLSGQFAAKLQAAGGTLPEQIRQAHFEALGRAPTADELAALTRYGQTHGLTNVCRALLNLNEFSFVD